MQPLNSRRPLYPKGHLLAASGIAALLSLALLVFPSREVEAKKTYLSQELELAHDSFLQEPVTPASPLELEEPQEDPFAQIAGNDSSADPEVPWQMRVTVSRGDTLSTIFGQVGLSAGLLHEMLSSSKEARQLGRLREGQELDFHF